MHNSVFYIKVFGASVKKGFGKVVKDLHAQCTLLPVDIPIHELECSTCMW